MSRAVRLWILFAVLLIVAAAFGLPRSAASSDPERAALLEDLFAYERGQTGPVQDDIFHKPQRPGKVVRVLPWLDADGSYVLIAVTEAGWVYRSGDDLSRWQLVGRILDGSER